jgi:hypothetical protein
MLASTSTMLKVPYAMSTMLCRPVGLFIDHAGANPHGNHAHDADAGALHHGGQVRAVFNAAHAAQDCQQSYQNKCCCLHAVLLVDVLL